MAEVMPSAFSELEMGIASAAPDPETRYAATGESAYDAVWGNIMLVEPVLAFLSIEDQLRTAENLSCVARAFYAPCQISDPASPLWRSFVQNLCAQRKLWVPDVVREGALLADASGGWSSLFEDLWPLRNQFASETQGAAAAEVRGGVSSKFRVATFCRFRTACARTAAAAATAATAGLRECPACLDGAKEGVNIALVPCGHIFCTEHAAQALKKKECHMCRGHVSITQRVFA
mmetsp:Transcript_15288/g.49000  ORF Transcript_15288/g.49000 Transcript_15288/m.49000 type:complete len:233 (-) Transcript_15288:455-1153(-)